MRATAAKKQKPLERHPSKLKKMSAYAILAIILISIMAVLFAFPLYWIITGSFKTGAAINATTPEWWPSQWVLTNYQKLFAGKRAPLWQLAGTALTMSLLNEMLKNPNVVAVKNSSMPTQDIQMFKDAGIAARGEEGFVVFNGPDEQFVSGRVIGADGGIGGTYAVMPELYLAMNAHLEKGEIAKARAIQYEANRIIYKMCSAHGNLYAVQKEILRRMYGLELGSVRAPMPGLIPEDEPIVAEAQAMIEAAIAKL